MGVVPESQLSLSLLGGVPDAKLMDERADRSPSWNRRAVCMGSMFADVDEAGWDQALCRQDRRRHSRQCGGTRRRMAGVCHGSRAALIQLQTRDRRQAKQVRSPRRLDKMVLKEQISAVGGFLVSVSCEFEAVDHCAVTPIWKNDVASHSLARAADRVHFRLNVTTIDVERVGRITEGITWRASGKLIECDRCGDLLPYRRKVVMMDEDAFVDRWVSKKGVPRLEALDMWFTETECPHRWDMNGPDGSLRIPINIIEDMRHVKFVDRGSEDIGGVACKVGTFHCTECLRPLAPARPSPKRWTEFDSDSDDSGSEETSREAREAAVPTAVVGVLRAAEVENRDHHLHDSQKQAACGLAQCWEEDWETSDFFSEPLAPSLAGPSSPLGQLHPVSLGAFADDAW
mmetsp:Transcript_98629/g.283480  ORF Transcript_98629/g.283480 Transcript_98629/m.283480 type:complete len:401 (+) Transcript_98629:86-1288(+)